MFSWFNRGHTNTGLLELFVSETKTCFPGTRKQKTMDPTNQMKQSLFLKRFMLLDVLDLQCRNPFPPKNSSSLFSSRCWTLKIVHVEFHYVWNELNLRLLQQEALTFWNKVDTSCYFNSLLSGSDVLGSTHSCYAADVMALKQTVVLF